MRIIGIDPGLICCGLGIIDFDNQKRKLKIVYYKAILSKKKECTEDKLLNIYFSISNILKKYQPKYLSLENVFIDTKIKSIILLSQVSGVIKLTARKLSIPIFIYTPTKIKLNITGNGIATKQQVSNMVSKILGIDLLTQPYDVSDALALAIVHAWNIPKL